MSGKLTEDKQREILAVGTREFSQHGLTDTSMSQIAKAAGISVGVLYKYYKDKDDFFMACVRSGIDGMKASLGSILAKPDKPLNYARALVEVLTDYSREHGEYIRLYNEITQMSDRADTMAREIEEYTAATYKEIIADAQAAGDIRRDLDPDMLAFFFDDLLMMMHFSYSVPYYQRRLEIYTGEDCPENQLRAREHLLRFMESAFTLESDEIKHRGE